MFLCKAQMYINLCKFKCRTILNNGYDTRRCNIFQKKCINNQKYDSLCNYKYTQQYKELSHIIKFFLFHNYSRKYCKGSNPSHDKLMCNYGITNEQFLGFFFPPTFLLSNMVTSIGRVSIKYCLQITYRLTINIKMITSVTDYYHNVSNFYCILSALSTESKCSTCEATAIIVIQSGP